VKLKATEHWSATEMEKPTRCNGFADLKVRPAAGIAVADQTPKIGHILFAVF
jgi:hypothetical protein